MKMCGAVEVQLLAFLISALSGVEWSLPRPGRFIAGERAPELDAADKTKVYLPILNFIS
jgi:hypothetical protein